jgi:MarR-like DNA-binding transcriptional regulator SgrR of sgrS sRNA
LTGGRLVALTLAAAGITAAHAETRPHYAGNIEGSLLGSPGTFDPVHAQSHAEITLAGLVFDTLYRVEQSGAVEPQLATGLPDLDATRTVAKITLLKGVRFHDGSLLTPQDVVASLERARSGSGRWALAPIASIKATGDVLELTLRAPTPELATLLALPPAAVTKAGKPPGEHPIGSGPFELESMDRANHRVVLKAFDDHFAGRPYTDRLVLSWFDSPDGEARRFEEGKAELSARGVAAFTGGQPKYRATYVEGPAAVLVFVGFGRAHPDVLADRGFRRALDQSLARGPLIAAVTTGERVVGAREPVPVEAGGSVLSLAASNGDLGSAQAALVDAATRVGSLAPAKLPQLRLEILFEDTRPGDREIAGRVARALEKLQIQAAITPVSATVLRERVARGTCDLWIGQLATPVTIATPWWTAAFAAGGDDWAATQLATGSLTSATALKTFNDRLPIVPLMFRAIRMWHRSDIHGLRFDASGRPCFAEMFLFGHAVLTGKKP